MDEKYINPIITAVKYVFKTMLDIDIEHGIPFIKDNRKLSGDITGVMALSGAEGEQRGMLAFSTSRKGALAIYKKLMHQEFQEITAEIIDGTGELTNIISGRARYELEREGVHLYAHVPIIFSGNNAEVNFITKISVISIPFNFFIDEMLQMNVDFMFE
jgi:chemotaxis protein CheX